MAHYRAAIDFADLQDGKHFYRAGDTFPREGLTVSAARLDELSGSDNRAGKPLIFAEPEKETPVEKPTKRRVKRNA